MTLQIEEGKFYRTRDGRKVGPIRKMSNAGSPFSFDIAHADNPHDAQIDECVWTREGKAYDGLYLDLVAEWTDELAAAAPFIQAGRYYKARNGMKVGPLRQIPEWGGTNIYKFTAPDPRGGAGADLAFTEDGKREYNGAANELDLMREWTEADTIKAVVSERIALRSEAQKAEMDKLLFADGPDVKAEILEEAGNIVNGARRKAYGTPENNFERIARFWQAYFDNTDRDVVITAADVSPMMRLMKEARLCETPDHKDSFVDIIGYALTGAEVNKVKPKNSD